MDTILSLFDFCWFWFGRVCGGAFIVALAIGIFLTILELVWLRVEKVCQKLGRVIQETKLFAEFLKWKRER